MLEAMFKLHFPDILKVQTMLTPIFGPDKQTGGQILNKDNA